MLHGNETTNDVALSLNITFKSAVETTVPTGPLPGLDLVGRLETIKRLTKRNHVTKILYGQTFKVINCNFISFLMWIFEKSRHLKVPPYLNLLMLFKVMNFPDYKQ